MIYHAVPNVFWAVHAGCTKVSSGCDNCAALVGVQSCSENQSYSWDDVLDEGDWNGHVYFAESQLRWPFRLRKRGLPIWVDQLGDMFHPLIDDNERDRVFGVIARLGYQRFIISTRRPQEMVDYLATSGRSTVIQSSSAEWNNHPRVGQPMSVWPFPNVIVGVSVSTQAEAEAAVPVLLTAQAEKKFVYVAPILEAIDLSAWPGIDWLIVRAEEGPIRRVPTPSWVQDLKNWAVAQGIPFNFKGWGEDIDVGTEETLRDAARGSIDLRSLPNDLRMRIDGEKWLQFP